MTPTISLFIKTRRLLEDFIKILPELEESFLESFANPFEEELCKCGSGERRLVHCQECFQYTPSCGRCFVHSHRSIRWHWASVWDPVKCIFSRADYCAVLPEVEGTALQLGHAADETSCSVNDRPQDMIVVHSNGVHQTKIRFCCCTNTQRAVQLIRAGLFPGSPTYPQTAFTFSLLKEFQAHTRQSRASAFDWIVSIRRMTNDVVPHRVPVRFALIDSQLTLLTTLYKDPYKSFLRVTRIWDHLTTRVRSGFAHRLNSLLPSRPKNAILYYCPACPEPGVNMFDGWKSTPDDLKYIAPPSLVSFADKLLALSGISPPYTLPWMAIIAQIALQRILIQRTARSGSMLHMGTFPALRRIRTTLTRSLSRRK
jgi:hypothetical protein